VVPFLFIHYFPFLFLYLLALSLLHEFESTLSMWFCFVYIMMHFVMFTGQMVFLLMMWEQSLCQFRAFLEALDNDCHIESPMLKGVATPDLWASIKLLVRCIIVLITQGGGNVSSCPQPMVRGWKPEQPALLVWGFVNLYHRRKKVASFCRFFVMSCAYILGIETSYRFWV
jgi:hypothetical protein